MKNWIFAIIIAAIALGLTGCGGGPGPGPGSGNTLSGKVVDGQTGNPLKDVRVAIGSSNTLSRADGTFTLVALQPGSAVLSAQLTGYETSTTQVSVTAGAQTLQDNVRLVSVTGDPPTEHVRTVDGTITLSGESNGTGVTVTLLSGSTEIEHMTTGTDGKYWFWASAGTYTVRAAKTGFVTKTSSVTVTDLTKIVTSNITLNR